MGSRLQLACLVSAAMALSGCGKAAVHPTELEQLFEDDLPRIRTFLIAQDPALATIHNERALVTELRSLFHARITFGDNYVSMAKPYEATVAVFSNPQASFRCFGISTLYRYALAAFGVSSRYVALLNSYDMASDGIQTHATTEVFVGGRWIAQDPTFDLAFVDPTGRYLSYAQVFARRAAGLPYQHTYDGPRPVTGLTWETQPFDTETYFNFIATFPGPFGADEAYLPAQTWDGVIVDGEDRDYLAIETNPYFEALNRVLERM